ncbi:hypothetical protein J6590_107918, partial [Homalodisca vitripennis]
MDETRITVRLCTPRALTLPGRRVVYYRRTKNKTNCSGEEPIDGQTGRLTANKQQFPLLQSEKSVDETRIRVRQCTPRALTLPGRRVVYYRRTQNKTNCSGEEPIDGQTGRLTANKQQFPLLQSEKSVDETRITVRLCTPRALTLPGRRVVYYRRTQNKTNCSGEEPIDGQTGRLTANKQQFPLLQSEKSMDETRIRVRQCTPRALTLPGQRVVYYRRTKNKTNCSGEEPIDGQTGRLTANKQQFPLLQSEKSMDETRIRVRQCTPRALTLPGRRVVYYRRTQNKTNCSGEEPIDGQTGRMTANKQQFPPLQSEKSVDETRITVRLCTPRALTLPGRRVVYYRRTQNKTNCSGEEPIDGQTGRLTANKQQFPPLQSEKSVDETRITVRLCTPRALTLPGRRVVYYRRTQNKTNCSGEEPIDGQTGRLTANKQQFSLLQSQKSMEETRIRVRQCTP